MSTEKKDIKNLDDVKLFVTTFYGNVRKDELLSGVFGQRIQDSDWPAHLEKMAAFWQTALLHEHTYYGSPFPPHATLPVEKQHFDRWLKLFFDAVDHFFKGETAEEAKWRASKMAEMFQIKISAMRQMSVDHR